MTERDDPRPASFSEPLFTDDDVTEDENLRVYTDKFLAAGKSSPEAPHPGLVLGALLESDEIDGEIFADWLKFPKQVVLGVLSGRVGVSSRLANRLAEKLGPEARFWLEIQRRFDQNHPHSDRIHSNEESESLDQDEDDVDLTDPSDNC